MKMLTIRRMRVLNQPLIPAAHLYVGIRHKTLPFFSVQFHPEVLPFPPRLPGPYTTNRHVLALRRPSFFLTYS